MTILQRLQSENLHGPLTLKRSSTTRNAQGNEWVLISNEYSDLDSADPRWFELFVEFFVKTQYEVHDDLLFFVRQYLVAQDRQMEPIDPVFVKRRVPNVMPSLSDAIEWKQSFFLNLISQLPCTLTASVCTRGVDELVAGHQEASKQAKSRMVAKRRITKKVFSAPYKSRMDVKDAFMNECSFPLVYYTVNDFESHALHLTICDKEYLCVELSLTIPDIQSSGAYAAATDAVASISLQQDNSPFPLPTGHKKVVLFQGAVSYSSLLDIYMQKGIAAQNQLKNAWSKMSKQNQPPMTDALPIQDDGEHTEYIMMRGPHGKGQCQVAIMDNETHNQSSTVSEDYSLNNASKSDSSPTITDRLRTFGTLVKNQLVGTSTPSDRSLSSYLKRPHSLRCSMTYVNIPWQSIINDLIEFAKPMDS